MLARFRKAQRYRSTIWWGVSVCALLLVGMYIFFDLLDVDGSEMTWRKRDMVVSAPATYGGRLCRADVGAPSLNDLNASFLLRLCSLERSRISAAKTFLPVWRNAVFPHRSAAYERSGGSPAAVDPL